MLVGRKAEGSTLLPDARLVPQPGSFLPTLFPTWKMEPIMEATSPGVLVRLKKHPTQSWEKHLGLPAVITWANREGGQSEGSGGQAAWEVGEWVAGRGPSEVLAGR